MTHDMRDEEPKQGREATPPDEAQTDHLTSASEPPRTERRRSRPRAIWPQRLEELRRHPNEWRRIDAPMSKSTAAQIASDLRNAHRRALENVRVSGIRPRDRFETEYYQDPSDPNPDHWYVWVRWTEASWDERDGLDL